MNNNVNVYDIIVVGAGAAGLTAAKEAVKAGKSVCVLEAQDRIGGRIKRGEIAGEVIDHGGMWVNLEQTLLLKEADNYGIELSRQYVLGNSILDLSGNKSYFNPDQMGLSFLSNFGLYLAVRRAEIDASMVEKGKPWKTKRAREWDSQSMQGWIDKNVRTKMAREYFQTSLTIEMSAEASQISYLYFLDLLHSEQGSDVSQGQWSHRFIGGTYAIFQKIADELGDRIVLSSPVTDIIQDDKGVLVRTDSSEYKGQYVINTAPPSIAANINYEPPLPVKRVAFMQNRTTGAAIKCYVAYEKPFWREKGLSGLIVNNTSPVSITLDVSPQDESKGLIVGMIVGVNALDLSESGSISRKHTLVKLLIENFGPEAASPIDYVDNNWLLERWSPGGYASHMPPGVLTMLRSDIYKASGRIHWAGTEMAKKWNGLISGAMESGKREAKLVIDKVK